MRRGGGAGWLLALAVFLIGIPLLEVYLLIQVGRQIGVLPTIGILVVEAIFGAWLMRREGLRAWNALNDTFARGVMPTGALADGALVLVGGALFTLPGFFTDVIGLICLLPFTRVVPRWLISRFAARQAAKHGIDLTGPVRRDPNVIPGEVVEDSGSAAAPAPTRTTSDVDPPALEGRVI